MTGTSRRFTRGALALLFGAGLLLPAAPALAGHGAGHSDVVVVKTLPHGYHTIRYSGHDYYVHQGRFYRRQPQGFVLVPAPVGAVVVSLPAGHVRLTVGGQVYFHYGSVYYRTARGGYRIVAPPAAAPRHVIIRPRHLNVRSGPGTGYAVMTRLPGGARLVVTGHSGGWYRVDLGAGRHGWISGNLTLMAPAP